MKIEVAAIVDEFDRIVLVIGDGNHGCQRFEIRQSLADKLEYELATIRINRRAPSEGSTS